jgi:hypothetical protein
MKWQVLVIVAIGLSLGADDPKKVEGKKKYEGKTLKDIPYYAKVEIQGYFFAGNRLNELMAVVVPDGPSEGKFSLDIRKLKGWTGDKVGDLNGRAVRVTGTLEFQPVPVGRGVTENRLVIVATTLEDVDPNPPIRKEP